jgi:hypothetical protein
MCKHLLGHDYVRPDRLHQFVLGYNAVGVPVKFVRRDGMLPLLVRWRNWVGWN